MFDNYLGTTYGFIAAVLIQHGLTGYCVTARGLSGPVQKWMCAGIPLTSLSSVKGTSQYGENKSIIPSAGVDLVGKAFLEFKSRRKLWVYEDHYCNPGPIQFYKFGKFSLTQTLQLEHENYNQLLEQIENYCQKIKTLCRFGAHEDLLKAAYYGLESITKILGTMKHTYDN
jgi:6-phosphofructokinase 1